MSTITRDEFNEWKSNSVTELLLLRIHQEREEMKEGLVNDNYSQPEEVKGRCKAIANLLDITYEDLVPRARNPNLVEESSNE